NQCCPTHLVSRPLITSIVRACEPLAQNRFVFIASVGVRARDSRVRYKISSRARYTKSIPMFLSEDFRLKVGLAEMLKGGVIMDVTNVEQAKIAEKAGAAAVMALERVPADIRKEGGVARMAAIRIIREIMDT